jgi:transposase
MEKALLYCGVDVSKDKLQLDGAALALPGQLNNDHSGYRQLIKAAKNYAAPLMVVFEATGPYHLGLALALWEAKIPLCILNPARVRHFAKALGKAKTDPLDASLIGAFARSLQPQAMSAPEPVRLELLELLQRRDGLVSTRAADQNRLGQCRHKLIKAQIASLRTQLARHIQQIDRLIQQLVNSSQELKAKVKVLCEVKGVGYLTAVTLLMTLPELGSLGRKAIARLVGLAPLNDESGQENHQRFIQGGRKQARRALYMPALSAARHNPLLKEFYQRLLKAGKLKKVALTAVMRKLLICLNALLRDFIDQHKATEAFGSAKATVTPTPNP